jgi:phage terminase small subunit
MADLNPPQRLTDKQMAFIDAYLGDAKLVASRAAILAGYPENSARQVGSENLSKPHIRAEIDRRLSDRAKSADEILDALVETAFPEVADLVEVDEGTGEPKINYQKARDTNRLHLLPELHRTEHGWRLRWPDRLEALKTLAKAKGLLKDTAEVMVRTDESAVKAAVLAKLRRGLGSSQ